MTRIRDLLSAPTGSNLPPLGTVVPKTLARPTIFAIDEETDNGKTRLDVSPFDSPFSIAEQSPPGASSMRSRMLAEIERLEHCECELSGAELKLHGREGMSSVPSRPADEASLSELQDHITSLVLAISTRLADLKLSV